jgi:hypothetical protein
VPPQFFQRPEGLEGYPVPDWIDEMRRKRNPDWYMEEIDAVGDSAYVNDPCAGEESVKWSQQEFEVNGLEDEKQ